MDDWEERVDGVTGAWAVAVEELVLRRGPVSVRVAGVVVRDGAGWVRVLELPTAVLVPNRSRPRGVGGV